MNESLNEKTQGKSVIAVSHNILRFTSKNLNRFLLTVNIKEKSPQASSKEREKSNDNQMCQSILL